MSVQQRGERLRPPDVGLLRALGSASQKDDELATTLRKVNTPAGSDMDSKLGHAVAHRFHVAGQASFKPLDPSAHDPTN